MIENLLRDATINNILELIAPKGILVDWQIKQLCVEPTKYILVELSSGKKVPVSLYDNNNGFTADEVIDYLHKLTTVYVMPLSARKPMIEHFVDKQVRLAEELGSEDKNRKIISYGLSSSGYDFRIAKEFKLFTNINTTVVDALNFDPNNYVEREGDSIIIPPNSFVLARTEEKFNMPKNVFGECLGKSTIARTGGNILVTPLEQGWSGYLTLEYANITPCPLRLHAGMGGGQIVFHRTDVPDVTYDERSGKYQDQAAEVVVPRL